MEISTTSDIEAFARTCFTAFGRRPAAKYVEQLAKLIDLDRAHVAYAEGTLVGCAGAYNHILAVPGGTVPAAAIFGAGVLPSHRRCGIMTRLQKVQLEDAHRRGESVAYLWPSEAAIYGRYGYGMASLAMRVAIEKGVSELRDPPRSLNNVRLVDRGEAHERVAAIYAKLWRDHPGMFSRGEDWWSTRLANPDLFFAVWDSAYALYTVNPDASSDSYACEVEVVEALASSVEGYANILRYLLGMDLVKAVKASYLPVDHPLILMLKDIRRANCRIRDGVWVRIIDVEAALRARALRGGCVVIRVNDRLLPHNDDTWRVGVGGVSRAATSPDLVIDIADLGSVYLGGFTFSDLMKSGRVHEQIRGAVHRADEVFAWDRKPWCPEPF
ncbi:GNAT family N-acetyltransferase [Steroidobacter cummioxidans]|uniref:GNAT family N-acetyltransferase n=1 Tax=Steroidobacter cummioxidans TaxID=1803913 RepID=UPI000E322FA3|nr:GNAT family N-acetyltransferase [Steroidobacter cummioxidans]